MQSISETPKKAVRRKIEVSSYRKGRKYEYKIRDILRGYGWVVWRLAGSKPVDLVAFRNFDVSMVDLTAFRCHDVAIIECKNYEYTKPNDIEKLRDIYRQISKPCYLIKPAAKGDFAYCIEKYGIAWGKYMKEVFK